MNDFVCGTVGCLESRASKNSGSFSSILYIYCCVAGKNRQTELQVIGAADSGYFCTSRDSGFGYFNLEMMRFRRQPLEDQQILDT